MLNGGGGILYSCQKVCPEGWVTIWPQLRNRITMRKRVSDPKITGSLMPFYTVKSNPNKNVYVFLIINRGMKNIVQGLDGGVRDESHLVGVLVSWGCCNKLPQTGWLKTTGIYSLTVPEARSPGSRCWQGRAPSRGSKVRSFFASSSFWELQAFLSLSLQHSSFCLCHHMAFSSMFLLFRLS